MWPELHVALPGGAHAIVSTHALCVVVAVIVGIALAQRWSDEPRVARLTAAVVAVFALVGAHALFVVQRGGASGGSSVEPWNGGLASMGGIAMALGAVRLAACVARRPPAALFDAIVPAGLVALGIGRFGCFLAGCCFGLSTSLPWGVVLARLGPPARHPLQLYSAGLDLLIAWLAVRRRRPPGETACTALVGFAAARIWLELLRDPAATNPLPGGLTVAQVACAGLLLGCTILYMSTRWRIRALRPVASRLNLP